LANIHSLNENEIQTKFIKNVDSLTVEIMQKDKKNESVENSLQENHELFDNNYNYHVTVSRDPNSAATSSSITLYRIHIKQNKFNIDLDY
jgi:hypothetical protein